MIWFLVQRVHVWTPRASFMESRVEILFRFYIFSAMLVVAYQLRDSLLTLLHLALLMKRFYTIFATQKIFGYIHTVHRHMIPLCCVHGTLLLLIEVRRERDYMPPSSTILTQIKSSRHSILFDFV